MGKLICIVIVSLVCSGIYSHRMRPWIPPYVPYRPPFYSPHMPLPMYPYHPFALPNLDMPGSGFGFSNNDNSLQPVDVKYFEATETVRRPTGVQQVPLIPRQPNTVLYPGNVPVLSAGQNTLVRKESKDSKSISQLKRCSTQNSNCSLGEQCVYADVRTGIFQACPNIPTQSCHCRPGCRHSNMFIPMGQSVVVNKCGKTCRCSNLYGTTDCDNKTCPGQNR